MGPNAVDVASRLPKLLDLGEEIADVACVLRSAARAQQDPVPRPGVEVLDLQSDGEALAESETQMEGKAFLKANKSVQTALEGKKLRPERKTRS